MANGWRPSRTLRSKDGLVCAREMSAPALAEAAPESFAVDCALNECRPNPHTHHCGLAPATHHGRTHTMVACMHPSPTADDHRTHFPAHFTAVDHWTVRPLASVPARSRVQPAHVLCFGFSASASTHQIREIHSACRYDDIFAAESEGRVRTSARPPASLLRLPVAQCRPEDPRALPEPSCCRTRARLHARMHSPAHSAT